MKTISEQQAIDIMKKHNVIITQEQAAIAIAFLTKLAQLSLAQLMKK